MKCTAPALATCLILGAILSRANPVQEPQSVPDSAEQQRLLAVMHRYASQYVANLPNFICQQVTHQFEAGRKAKHWHKGDTLAYKLVFNEGREERTVEFVNDRPVRGAGFRYWRAPLTSEGEFGMLIETVFGDSSAARFSWNRWDTIDGQSVAVFDYAIARDHSTLSLSLSDIARAVVAYHGSIYADPQSGAIRRITNAADDIPPEVQTRSIGTTIDYAEVDIAGRRYLLPATAVVALTTDSSNIRNEISFQSYRKFETESRITYAAGASPEQ
ncbi:MAG: hypothetical protein JOY54_03715 [Acidobacteriaceae bacterium]|nr:hypothetical protein [Acidobacteriaceae bacterium]